MSSVHGETPESRGPHAAIVLAGGRARRLDGAAKALLTVGGKGLLRTTIDAAAASGCDPIVVVGPPSLDHAAVTWVREQPPFGGPVAAIVAALPHIHTDSVVVLATDLPRASEALAFLLETTSLVSLVDGLCLADEAGRPQWLTGLYRTAALRAAGDRLPDAGAGASMHALLSELEIATVRAPSGIAGDVDTWEDLVTARRRAARSKSGDDMTESSRTLPPEALDTWAAALSERLGLAEGELPVSLVLDLARDVANGVARPAAPLSAFAAGLAAGRRGGSPADIEAVVAEVTALAATWERG